MPRFYFHVRSSASLIRDEEGVTLSDIEGARWEAELGARSLLAAAVEKGEVVNGQAFEVTDEGGRVLFTFPFREALKLA